MEDVHSIPTLAVGKRSLSDTTANEKVDSPSKGKRWQIYNSAANIQIDDSSTYSTPISSIFDTQETDSSHSSATPEVPLFSSFDEVSCWAIAGIDPDPLLYNGTEVERPTTTGSPCSPKRLVQDFGEMQDDLCYLDVGMTPGECIDPSLSGMPMAFGVSKDTSPIPSTETPGPEVLPLLPEGPRESDAPSEDYPVDCLLDKWGGWVFVKWLDGTCSWEPRSNILDGRLIKNLKDEHKGLGLGVEVIQTRWTTRKKAEYRVHFKGRLNQEDEWVLEKYMSCEIIEKYGPKENTRKGMKKVIRSLNV